MNVIAGNIGKIRVRIADACARVGRSPDDVQLMAVSKTHPATAIHEAYEADIRLFGENRVQEFADKVSELHDLKAQFHLIGHLQSNKAGKAAELFQRIDSIDSLKVARKLNDEAARLNKRLAILVEINVGGEETKSGFAPDSSELTQLLTGASELSSLEIRGLMTIPPHTDDPNGARPYFKLLRALRDRLRTAELQLPDLSMGMSHDFEVAIEEGSTCVRVGTAIFGKRENLAHRREGAES